jgi:transitional endoplasmic reticulum ATPase
VGRGIAMIDPEVIADLGIEAQDVIQIRGKRLAIAKAVPTPMPEGSKDAIQIDGIIRENARTGLGEKVQIARADYTEANKVVLIPTASSAAFVQEKDSAYLGRLLDGLAVMSGDKVRAILFGTSNQEFYVADTIPQGMVVIGSETKVEIQKEAAGIKEDVGVTYEDIGGLHKEVQRIREMVELPLKYPEVFERLGIEPPKGVLLYGPPGCGKTLIARAVANETDAFFQHISGPEITHKYYGESEAHLREIFESAQEHAPAIIFIDELDAIAPKREETRGDEQVERRVVAQLLALMDGLKSRGKVVVIGATNIPNVLDTALRRPGRFDREISISIPDRKGRLEILYIHARGMPLAPDVNLEKLAEVTHGFVGADLAGLVREAAMITFRRIMPQVEFETNRIPYELLLQLEVTMDDFVEALKEIEPSAMREVLTDIPDINWNDIGGLEEAKRVLEETVQWPLKYPAVFKQAHTSPPKGILLTGPPGTGKTLLAKAVANESGVNFISVKGPALLSKWAGGSEHAVRDLFKKAKQTSPCILFFDEIDAITQTRRADDDSQTTENVISQLLAEMDGMEELEGVVVLGASNRPDLIDPALLRAGRFDFRLELPLPDKQIRLEIFRIQTRNKPLSHDVKLDYLAQVTEGMVGSDIEAITRKAAMLAIREFVQQGKEDLEKLEIRAQHFNQALEAFRATKAPPD